MSPRDFNRDCEVSRDFNRACDCELNRDFNRDCTAPAKSDDLNLLAGAPPASSYFFDDLAGDAPTSRIILAALAGVAEGKKVKNSLKRAKSRGNTATMLEITPAKLG